MGQHSIVNLSAEQRQHLTRLTRSGRHSARLITRAKILLLVDRNQPAPVRKGEVARLTQTSPTTVTRICRRYQDDGLEAALHEQPRPGAVPKITGEIEAQLVLLACSDPPAGAARWTLSLLRQRVIAEGWLDTVSDNALGNRLKKTRSSPG